MHWRRSACYFSLIGDRSLLKVSFQFLNCPRGVDKRSLVTEMSILGGGQKGGKIWSTSVAKYSSALPVSYPVLSQFGFKVLIYLSLLLFLKEDALL